MAEDDLKKYAERAGEVLANFAVQKKKKAKSVDEAAQEFIEGQKNFKYIEPLFNANSVEIILKYLKKRYQQIDFPERTEKLIKALRVYSEEKTDESLAKAKKLYQQIIEDMKGIEKNILKEDKEYKPKFLV
ncbi:MAG: hypothetical protein JW827_10135 [Spirochaetes bacterium]|nr:hypothetical protein [Spirochaetota bacterium]